MSTSDEKRASAAPDIDRASAGDWPQRAFPIDDGRRENSVRVVFKQSVLNDIHDHGQSRTDVEICGVMIGNGYRDERGPYIYIEQIIRGQHTESQAAQVTFTGETWNYIHNCLDSKYPDLRILGWYHTHPGFGIFLSGMDLFIHENYFNAPEQLALVYDCISGDEGLFVWRDGKAQRDGFLIEPDAEEDPPPEPRKPPAEKRLSAGAADGMAEDVAATDADELFHRIERIERRQNMLAMGLMLALMMAVVIPVAVWFSLGGFSTLGDQQPSNQPNKQLPNPATKPSPKSSLKPDPKKEPTTPADDKKPSPADTDPPAEKKKTSAPADDKKKESQPELNPKQIDE